MLAAVGGAIAKLLPVFPWCSCGLLPLCCLLEMQGLNVALPPGSCRHSVPNEGSAGYCA